MYWLTPLFIILGIMVIIDLKNAVATFDKIYQLKFSIHQKTNPFN
jgi:hypothetical protein